MAALCAVRLHNHYYYIRLTLILAYTRIVIDIDIGTIELVCWVFSESLLRESVKSDCHLYGHVWALLRIPVLISDICLVLFQESADCCSSEPLLY